MLLLLGLDDDIGAFKSSVDVFDLSVGGLLSLVAFVGVCCNVDDA